mmetsp:Transcript_22156/g.66265  ORF Transcript_22156/g.66265 Transcript_22156/m.66265 type:complete len:252 (-) Transcript_22156:455-1210(-)
MQLRMSPMFKSQAGASAPSCFGTENVWTSCCGGNLKPISKCPSWSRAYALEPRPMSTLSPRHVDTFGNKLGWSTGRRRVKPRRGNAWKSLAVASTRRSNCKPMCDVFSGLSEKVRQPLWSSSISRRVAVKPSLDSTHCSCKRPGKNRNSGKLCSGLRNAPSRRCPQHDVCLPSGKAACLGLPVEEQLVWASKGSEGEKDEFETNRRVLIFRTTQENAWRHCSANLVRAAGVTRWNRPSPMGSTTTRAKSWH